MAAGAGGKHGKYFRVQIEKRWRKGLPLGVLRGNRDILCRNCQVRASGKPKEGYSPTSPRSWEFRREGVSSGGATIRSRAGLKERGTFKPAWQKKLPGGGPGLRALSEAGPRKIEKSAEGLRECQRIARSRTGRVKIVHVENGGHGLVFTRKHTGREGNETPQTGLVTQQRGTSQGWGAS